MSDPSSVQAQMLEETAWLVENYAIAASSALWFLDYIQTLPTEMRAIWFKRPNLTIILFLVNRYAYMFYQVVFLVATVPGNTSDQMCQRLYIAESITQLAPATTSTLLFLLRVYALYEQSNIILGFGMVMILLRLSLEVYIRTFQGSVSTIGSPFESFSRCGIVNFSPQSSIKLQYVLKAIPIVVESIMLVLLWRKAMLTARENWRQKTTSIAQRLIYHGIFYYLVVLATSVVQPVFLSFSLFIPQSSATIPLSVTNMVIQPLSNIFVNRMVLNLRTYDSDSPLAQSTKRLSEPVFVTNRFLGSIGGPIDYEQWDKELDEDDGVYKRRSKAASPIATGRSYATDEVVTLLPVVFDEENASSKDIQMVSVKRSGRF